MKIIDRCLLFLLSLVFLLSSFGVPTIAEGDHPLLIDEAGLLSSRENENLTETLDHLSDSLDFDIVVITLDSLNGNDVQAYADTLYDRNGYGRNFDHRGILFLIAMEERRYAYSTCGEAIPIFSEDAFDRLESEMVPLLKDGDYNRAFLRFAECCEDIILDYQYYESRTDVDIDPIEDDPWGKIIDDPYFDDPSYYPSYDYRPHGYDYPLSMFLLISFGFGLTISLIILWGMAKKLKSVKPQKYAGRYITSSGLRLTEKRDVFLYRRTSRTYRSDSSTNNHHSSSFDSSHTGGVSGGGGVSHGGRSGGF